MPQNETIAFLQEAKAAALLMEAQKKERSGLVVEEKRLEKIYTGEQQLMQDDIDAMIRQRKTAISDSYDKEIAAGKEKLRKVKVKKEKAKEMGQAERIKMETSVLMEENRELHTKLRTEFKQHAVPKWCDSKLFYALYMPKSFGDAFLDLILFLIIKAVLPLVIFYFLPTENPYVLAGIFVADMIFFDGLYLIINSRVKMRHLDMLQLGGDIRSHIRSNKKKIQVITKAIQNDKTEDAYDLDKYNDAIRERETELKEVSEKKQKAMATFESVTRKTIITEITDSRKAHLEELKNSYEAVANKRKALEDKMRTDKIAMTDKYEGYLGKDFLQADKIDTLIEILESNQAATITEAITVYRNSNI